MKKDGNLINSSVRTWVCVLFTAVIIFFARNGISWCFSHLIASPEIATLTVSYWGLADKDAHCARILWVRTKTLVAHIFCGCGQRRSLRTYFVGADKDTRCLHILWVWAKTLVNCAHILCVWMSNKPNYKYTQFCTHSCTVSFKS